MGRYSAPSFGNKPTLEEICIEAQDNFIYFLSDVGRPVTNIALRDADGYSFRENRWDKIPELRGWESGNEEPLHTGKFRSLMKSIYKAA